MNAQRPTILVVEDDPNDQKLIKRAMLKAGIASPVRAVTDGESAIAYLSGTAPYSDRDQYPLPALMLLDLKMPRKNGFEVLTWLRQQPKLKRLPVIVLTSSRESADVVMAYDLGANSYLVKPVGNEALAALIRTVENYWLAVNTPPELE